MSKKAEPHEAFRVSSPGKCRCDDCPSACCWYVCIEITSDNLTTDDIDTIRYYLMHDGMMILFSAGSWNAYVKSRCRHVVEANGKHRCAIYNKRPNVCKNHSESGCNEREWFLYGTRPEGELIFTTVEEFDKWRSDQAKRLSK